LALRIRVFGEQDARTAESINLLGSVLYESGKYDEAMREFQKVLPLDRHIYGDNHPTVATDLNNIGRAALMTGDIDAAEPVLRQALAMIQAFEGDNHDYLVSPLNSLAMIDAYHGNLERAKAEIDRAVAIARLPDHGELLDQVLLNAADLAIAAGNPANAKTLLAEAKSALERAHPLASDNVWRYAVWDSVNARLLGVEGNRLSAKRILATAEGALSARFGPNGFYMVRAERTGQELMNAAPAR
jgi:tetratricopeptide (TPR) repeat protein